MSFAQRLEEELEQTSLPPENDKVHIINPPRNKHIIVMCGSSEFQDIVDFARVNRWRVVALCGHIFVPTQNPEDVHDTCEPCLKAAALIMESENN